MFIKLLIPYKQRILSIVVFWVMTPCSDVVGYYQRCCFLSTAHQPEYERRIVLRNVGIRTHGVIT